MTSLRHIALGCCVLSALAGILRLFWPENGFKSVINAVLVLYILTVGVQLVHGLDWDGLVRELRSLPDGQDTADYSDYSRELALAASVDAVREVLRNAGINAAVSWQNGVCVIPWTRATSLPLRPCSPSMQGNCPGALRRLPHDRPGASGSAGRPAARSAGR